jgi:hypothetical protein
MKAAILLTLTLLASAAFADNYPYPDPGGPGNGGPSFNVCNIDYNGAFQFGGGPLTVSLRQARYGSRYVDVVVYFQNRRYFGNGVCDARGVDFTLENGYRHIGRFQIGNRGERIIGNLYYNGRMTDRFAVYQY